jgi:hypothetical protein
LAFGIALVSAGATELEIDVMRAPAGWTFQMLPPGTRFSKGQFPRQISPNLISDAGRWTNGGILRTGTTPSVLPGDDPAHPGFSGKVGH